MYSLLFWRCLDNLQYNLHLASIDLLDQVSCIAIGGTRNGTFSGIPKTTDNAVRLLPMAIETGRRLDYVRFLSALISGECLCLETHHLPISG